MNITIDSSEISEEKMEKLTQFLREHDLDYCYNAIGIDFELPLENLDEFNWLILKTDET